MDDGAARKGDLRHNDGRDRSLSVDLSIFVKGLSKILSKRIVLKFCARAKHAVN